MAQRPVGKADHDQVAALHAQGLSRNAIARQIGRSGRTVSRIADQLGLTFERGPQVAAATQARKVDAKARRAQLALDLLDDAARLREQLWQPCRVYNFGGKDNTFEQAEISEPSFRDKRDIMTSVKDAIGKAIDIDRYDSGAGLGEVVSLLDRLATGLTGKHGAGDNEHPVDETLDG